MTTAFSQRSPQKAWPGWIAWALWILCFTVIIADVARKRANAHTTTPTYRFATTEWWRGEDPYTFDRRGTLPMVTADTLRQPNWWMVQHDDFVYFPQAAVLFTPYNLMPYLLGEILWRATTFGLFAYALVRLQAFFLPGDTKTFTLLSLLAIPSAFASLRNAQFDLPLAALIVLATAEIAAARWTPAAAWLCLALALKPLAAVPVLLFGALYWKLIPRVIAGLLIVAALPFLHWSPAYVAHEYVRCAQALTWASAGDAPKFSDLYAMVSHFGFDAPDHFKTASRVLFALVYLGLGAMAFRRLDRAGAAWAIGALSADYLMLFNPRTETCSYVFLGPFVASLALLYAPQAGRKWFACVLGFAALGLACDAIPVVHGFTDRWFKPLIALLFLPVVVEFIFQKVPATRPATPTALQ
jgi:alpha-1,2-mannosyltransferase